MGLKKYGWILLLAVLLAAGCSSPGPNGIPTARPLTATTEARTGIPPTPTSTPFPTASPTRTASPNPVPTGTPSPTPTVRPQIAAAAGDRTNVYAGPGPGYPLLAILTAGFQVQLIGADESGAWLVVRLPHETQGWVAVDRLTGGYDAAALAVVAAPPKPPPTPTPVPTPAVIVSPAALAPNAKYTVTVLHFSPHERITVKIHAAATGFLEFAVNTSTRDDGSAVLYLATSRAAKEGAYILSVLGENGEYAEATFYVGPPQ